MKKVVLAAHRVEEIVIISHKMMKEEEGRRTAAVKAFELTKKKSQELTAKLVEVDRTRKVRGGKASEGSTQATSPS